MNNNEKKEVLEMLGVKILEQPPIYKSDKIDFVGCINGFFIFPCSYYWVVKGKMPFIQAEKLYKHRDLEIRVAGGSKENKPEDWCTNEEFEKVGRDVSKRYSAKIIELNELMEESAIAKEKYIKSNLENSYVEMYHIDTIQGLRKVVEIIKDNNIKTEWG